jgi:uncharacterized protein YkuJ
VLFKHIAREESEEEKGEEKQQKRKEKNGEKIRFKLRHTVSCNSHAQLQLSQAAVLPVS